ncbi:MAG TPA: hypothetical protein VG102_01565 [Candidatus Paceibacterota bacterium]|jgi:hypothetical protein|nr:hypothetical protein [Candidatus Paceibacterota bacterium]
MQRFLKKLIKTAMYGGIIVLAIAAYFLVDSRGITNVKVAGKLPASTPTVYAEVGDGDEGDGDEGGDSGGAGSGGEGAAGCGGEGSDGSG